MEYVAPKASFWAKLDRVTINADRNGYPVGRWFQHYGDVLKLTWVCKERSVINELASLFESEKIECEIACNTLSIEVVLSVGYQQDIFARDSKIGIGSEWVWELKECNVSELLGKTLIKVEQKAANGNILPSASSAGNDSILFTCKDGTVYHMLHDQECCEVVTLEDICGDISDLIGSPITMSEEISSRVEPPKEDTYWDGNSDEYTWTFYKFATNKGYVTLRWYGTSNGYYSERVGFFKENLVIKGSAS